MTGFRDGAAASRKALATYDALPALIVELLAAAATGPSPAIDGLRAEFWRAIQPYLDYTHPVWLRDTRDASDTGSKRPGAVSLVPEFQCAGWLAATAIGSMCPVPGWPFIGILAVAREARDEPGEHRWWRWFGLPIL